MDKKSPENFFSGVRRHDCRTAGSISGAGADKSNPDISACISGGRRDFSGYECKGGIV